MEVSGTIGLAISITGSKALDLSTMTDPFRNPTQSVSIADGAGVNSAEAHYHDQISIPDGDDTTLDLETLTDPFGDALAFTKIKALLIQNLSEDATLIVGNPTANPVWLTGTNVIPVPPGGRLYVECHTAAGITVDATHSDLKLTHDGTGTDAMLVNIYALGETS